MKEATEDRCKEIKETNEEIWKRKWKNGGGKNEENNYRGQNKNERICE